MKYQIIEILKKKEMNAEQIRLELIKQFRESNKNKYLKAEENLGIHIQKREYPNYDIDLGSVRVVLSRLLKDKVIKIVSNDKREYTYKYNFPVESQKIVEKSVENLENYKVAFTEFYLFFTDIMSKPEIIKDKELWNETWNKRNKEEIFEKARELKLLE